MCHKLLTIEENSEVEELIDSQHPADRLAIKQGFLARLTSKPHDDSAWSWLVAKCCKPPRAIEKNVIEPPVVVVIQDQQGGLF